MTKAATAKIDCVTSSSMARNSLAIGRISKNQTPNHQETIRLQNATEPVKIRPIETELPAKEWSTSKLNSHLGAAEPGKHGNYRKTRPIFHNNTAKPTLKH